MLEPFPNAVRVHADNYELERHRNGATGTLVQQRALALLQSALVLEFVDGEATSGRGSGSGGLLRRHCALEAHADAVCREGKVKLVPLPQLCTAFTWTTDLRTATRTAASSPARPQFTPVANRRRRESEAVTCNNQVTVAKLPIRDCELKNVYS